MKVTISGSEIELEITNSVDPREIRNGWHKYCFTAALNSGSHVKVKHYSQICSYSMVYFLSASKNVADALNVT